MCKNPADEDPHAVLNLPKDASEEAIKERYYDLAWKYHPNGRTPNEEKFKRISKAHEALTNVPKSSGDTQSKADANDGAAQTKAEERAADAAAKRKQRERSDADVQAFGEQVRAETAQTPPFAPPRGAPPSGTQAPPTSTGPSPMSPRPTRSRSSSDLGGRTIAIVLVSTLVASIAVIVFAATVRTGASAGCQGPTSNRATACPGAYNCDWYLEGTHDTVATVSGGDDPVRLLKVDEVSSYYYGVADTQVAARNVWMLTGRYYHASTQWCRLVFAEVGETGALPPSVSAVGLRSEIAVAEQMPRCHVNLRYEVLSGELLNYREAHRHCSEHQLEHEGFDSRPLFLYAGAISR
jgi:hypothetical protein